MAITGAATVPEEIASFVFFLAWVRANVITGAGYPINGAYATP